MVSGEVALVMNYFELSSAKSFIVKNLVSVCRTEVDCQMYDCMRYSSV